MDLQALYPSHVLPTFISSLPRLYVNMSSDPLIGGAMGYFGAPQNYVWFKSFLLLEMWAQHSFSIKHPNTGITGSSNFQCSSSEFEVFGKVVNVIPFTSIPLTYSTDCRSIYVLLLIYGASTTTTLFPCLAVLLTTPITSPETITAKAISITSEQRTLLLSSYIPFLIIPLTLTIDMAFRVLRLAQAGVAAEKQIKSR